MKRLDDLIVSSAQVAQMCEARRMFVNLVKLKVRNERDFNFIIARQVACANDTCLARSLTLGLCKQNH